MTPTTTQPYCPQRIRIAGQDRACSQRVGLVSWHDHTGTERWACTRHQGGLRRRYPATVPASA